MTQLELLGLTVMSHFLDAHCFVSYNILNKTCTSRYVFVLLLCPNRYLNVRVMWIKKKVCKDEEILL